MDDAEPLLDVVNPARRPPFRDEYLEIPFDLSAVLWIATATDPAAIAQPVRQRLNVVERPEYSQEEKLSIAQRYLLARPFDDNTGQAPARSAMRETSVSCASSVTPGRP